MTRPIGIGVLGCGSWGRNHIRLFDSLPGATLRGVSDLDERSLARIEELFPAVRREPEPRKLLNDSGVDAVVVATPTSTHYELVREALLAHKHVLCEKPLCRTAVEAGELVGLAASRGLILMVGHVFLFNPGIVTVKEWIRSGDIGSVYYLSAVRTNLGPIRSDVNAAYDLASHDIAIFNWLLDGEPEVVSASGAALLQPGLEDVVFVSLLYPGNVLANIHASWLDPKKVRQLTVVGSRKMLTWNDLEPNTPVAVYDRGAGATKEYSDYGEFFRVTMWDADVRLLKIGAEEPLKAQNRYFLRAVQQGRLDRSDGRFGLQVVRTLEAVAAALRARPVAGR